MSTIQAVLGVGGQLIDELFTSEEEKAQARLALLRLQQDGKLKMVEQQMSVMLAEAKSADPWTSRARPAFMYVCYVLILMAPVVGIVSVFSPDAAGAITAGMTAYLSALPGELYALLGTVVLGYQAARSHDKSKLLSAKQKAGL